MHLLGICGVGMAGLAVLLQDRGLRVSGCDLSVGPLATWLRNRGIEVYDGHAPSHVDGDIAFVIRSAAVPLDSLEIARARQRGIPVFDRGEVLPRLLCGYTSIAVSGTHGKTTTAWFITQILQHAGLDPAWCIGGELVGEPPRGVAGVREQGEKNEVSAHWDVERSRRQAGVIVVEADESDGTVALYEPDIAVVTNVEFDHMEHFEDQQAFQECFRQLIRGTRRTIVYGADDPVAAALCSAFKDTVSFGLSADCRLRARDIEEAPGVVSFSLISGGEAVGVVRLPVPGRHNVLNALAAAAAAMAMGVRFEAIIAALAQVQLPRRRFEKTVDTGDLVVISDYAHHPSEIAALVSAARALGRKRILAVFQPHRYTRTRALGSAFPPAFDGVDELILLPVYAASEEPLRGGTVWDLYRQFRDSGTRELEDTGTRGHRNSGSLTIPTPRVATSLDQAWQYLRRELCPGDLLLVIGAGDVEKVAHWAAQACRDGNLYPEAPKLNGLTSLSSLRKRETVGGKTTIKTGGKADVWVDVGSVEDLRAILKWSHEGGMPFQLLGAGSNVLVSDLGVRGVVARLSGPVFSEIRQEDGLVVVGAAVSMAKLQDWLERHGQGGLESLEGIPGSVGGAVHMNAGAYGDEIGNHLSRIAGVNPDGSECLLQGPELGLGYRLCEGLRGKVVVEAALRVTPTDPDVVRQRRAAIAERRSWMKGIRSAGSIFRNPPGEHAGRLSERAGMKGTAVGGATVLERHGNVIVTRPGATASDVRALIELVRANVLDHSGIELQTEVEFID